MRAEAKPRLSLYGALDLAILARWIAMAVVIIVGASAGKQTRILIRCPDLSGLHPKDKNPMEFLVYQVSIINKGGTEHGKSKTNR